MRKRSNKNAASAYIMPNTATSFEVQKRKVGYHGTLSKVKNCLSCANSRFRKSSGGTILHTSMTCTKCPFAIGEYGVCRNWQGKVARRKGDFLTDLGIDDIMEGVV